MSIKYMFKCYGVLIFTTFIAITRIIEWRFQLTLNHMRCMDVC